MALCGAGLCVHAQAPLTVCIAEDNEPLSYLRKGEPKGLDVRVARAIAAEMGRELDERAGDPEAVAELGVAYAALQCSDLLARGAPGIHFYTLNRSPATRAILAALRAAHPWTRAAAPV